MSGKKRTERRILDFLAETGEARYETGEFLGRGAMGEVHAGWDRELKRKVALKYLTLRSDSEAGRLRFRREAQAAAALNHPSIVRVFDVGERGGRLFLVMELVEGASLRALMREPGASSRLPAVLEQAARGLAAAHAQGIVHRDVKPENILVGADGAAKVTDFGLARGLAGETPLTATGAVFGTPQYMAPEQAAARHRDVGPRSDVFALGVILYEILTGRPPFVSSTPVEVLERVIRSDPPAPRTVDSRIHRDLESICLKAIEKEPARRYAHAGEFADDLKRHLDGRPVLARPSGPAYRLWRRARRHPVHVALAVALIAIPLLLWTRPSTVDPDAEAKETARQASEAYLELCLRTLDPMKKLQDFYYGPEATPAGIEGPLREIGSAASASAAKYPKSHLARAWKGLALHYARRTAEAQSELDAACREAGADPFPHLIKARASLARYADRTEIPPFTMDLSGTVEPPRFADDPKRAEAIREAERSVARVGSLPAWRFLRQGREYLAFVDGVQLLDGRRNQAASRALEGIRTDPVVGDEACIVLGFSRFMEGAYREAAEHWETAGRRGWIWSLLAASNARLLAAVASRRRGVDPRHDVDRAWESAVRLAGLEPGWVESHLIAGHARLFRARMFPGEERTRADLIAAAADFGRAIDRAEALFARGQAHLALASEEERCGGEAGPWLDLAEKDFEECARRSHRVVESLTHRAGAIWRRGGGADAEGAEPFYEGALAELSRAGALDSSSFEVHYRRAQILLSKGKWEANRGRDPRASYGESAASAQRAVALRPESAETRYMLAAAFYEQGLAETARRLDGFPHYARAIAECNRALEEVPGDGSLRWLRGAVHVARGHAERSAGRDPIPSFAEALADFEAAARGNPNQPLYWFGVGDAMGLLGRTAEAIEALDRSLKINPNQPRVRARLEEIRGRR